MALQSAFTLNANEVFATCANMIISQQVFADNLGKHQTLVDRARVDGSLFGDKKIYYSTNVLKSKPWTGDNLAPDLLALHRPNDPKVQEIELNKFRYIPLTTDQYLSKRFWMDASAFESFNAVYMAWMADTKKIYEGTIYNVFIGTTETSVGKQTQTVSLTSGKEGQELGEFMANLLVDMGNYNRVYNDYGFMRSYAEGDIDVIWNSNYVNKIIKNYTPTIFHKEGLVDKLSKDALPPEYFGEAIADITSSTYADATPTTSKPVKNSSGTYTYEPVSGNTVELHFLDEVEVPVYDTTASKYVIRHFFAGEAVPNKCAVKGTFTAYAETRDGGISTTSSSVVVDIKALTYKVNSKIICKVVTKLPPFMGSFATSTEFLNTLSLTRNNYLIWGFNTLAYLKNYPFVTIKQA